MTPILSNSREISNVVAPIAANSTAYVKLTGTQLSLLSQPMLAIAALIALILTPILILLDIFKTKQNSSSEIQVPSIQTKEVAIVNSILDFYEGGRNDQGVTLEEVCKWDDRRLEENHSFIQWLFPTRVVGVNPTAALTDNKTIAAFNSSPELRAKMIRSFDLMLKFYGFNRSSDNKITIDPQTFVLQSQNWLNRGNHNYRRITRILTSLSLHGLKDHAKSFLQALEIVYKKHSDCIGTQAFSFWQRALK